METRALGNTGIQVPIIGLGSGGHSKLGNKQDKGEENGIQVVKTAIESGVTLIDTAAA